MCVDVCPKTERVNLLFKFFMSFSFPTIKITQLSLFFSKFEKNNPSLFPFFLNLDIIISTVCKTFQFKKKLLTSMEKLKKLNDFFKILTVRFSVIIKFIYLTDYYLFFFLNLKK